MFFSDEDTKMASKIFRVNRNFHDYLVFIKSLVCAKCSLDRHSRGGFMFLLDQGPKISPSEFNSWLEDEEHGFLHGLMVGFWAYLKFRQDKCLLESATAYGPSPWQRQDYKPTGRDILCERIIYSCLFHDFMKTIGYSNDHDSLLAQVFPFCVDETYSHACPAGKPDEWTLVMGDRIELLRFDDHRDWVKPEMLSCGIYDSDFDTVSCFYGILRPAIAALHRSRSDLWVFHSSEHLLQGESDFFHDTYYPQIHWCPIEDEYGNQPYLEDAKKYVSVDVDFMSRRSCGLHAVKGFGNRSLLQCVGLIPKATVVACGNRIGSAPITSIGRDHPFLVVEKPMPKHNWIFAYRKVHGCKCVGFDQKIISLDNLNDFCDLCSVLIAKILAIKVA